MENNSAQHQLQNIKDSISKFKQSLEIQLKNFEEQNLSEGQTISLTAFEAIEYFNIKKKLKHL